MRASFSTYNIVILTQKPDIEYKLYVSLAACFPSLFKLTTNL